MNLFLGLQDSVFPFGLAVSAMTFSKVRQGRFGDRCHKRTDSISSFPAFCTSRTMDASGDAGSRLPCAGARGSGMKPRSYITRLLLFSFLLALPVWAQDEVAPDPDAATPAVRMPAQIAGWTQRLVLTTVRMTWRAKTSRSPPGRASTRRLRAARRIAWPWASSTARSAIPSRTWMRCWAGRRWAGKKRLSGTMPFTDSLLAGATNVSVLHQYRRESQPIRIRPFLASGES
jgi:hypothetical protein